MKVPIVIYGNSGRQVIGEVDVYAKDWMQLPKEHQLDLDLLVLSKQVEFVFHIQGQGANPTAKVKDEPECICLTKGNSCGGPERAFCHQSCSVCHPEEEVNDAATASPEGGGREAP